MNNKLKYIFYKFISSVTLGKTRKIYIQKKNKYKSNKTFDIMSYECNRKAGQEVRENYAFESDITGLITYQTLNKIKEIDLKRKVREGKKVKVCFLLDDISRFSAITTYQYMIESNLFEPFLVLYNSQNDDFKEGGDFFLHKDAQSLLEYVAKEDKIKNCTIATNCILIPKEETQMESSQNSDTTCR